MSPTFLFAFLQQPPSPLDLLDGVLMVALPLVSSVIFQALKKAAGWIGALPDLAKVVAVLIVNWLITILAYVSGLELPIEGGLWTVTTIEAVLAWLASMGVHALGKSLVSKK